VTPQTIFKLVLLLGVVLMVASIGIRARLEQPLLLLKRPALALRAMVAMYVAVPAFVLLLVWLVPLRCRPCCRLGPKKGWRWEGAATT
jgi:hypothetical protein